MTFSVFDAAGQAPERPALVLGSRTVTYAELADQVGRRVEWLSSRGVTPRSQRPVAVVGRSDLGTLTLVYALFAMECPVALVHPRLTLAERADVVSLVGPVLVVLEAPPDDPTPGRHPPSLLPEPGGDEACLALLFTSGTTGEPKGVVLSRRAFVASAGASEKNLPLGPCDRWLLGLPLAHVGGLSVVTRCLLSRSTVVVPEEVLAGARLDPDGLARALERDVTHVSLVPTQLEWLLAREPQWSPPGHLRAVLLGGAPARPLLLERAAARGVPVLTTYGLTEACSQVTTQRAGTANLGEADAGVPLPGTEVRIEDGVILVRGRTLLSGYLTRGGLVSAVDSEGFFHTDDLGRLDAEGRLHVLGRRSETLITGGENVHPAEVEATLERCPGIAAACVFGVPDDTWGQIVAAALVETHPGALETPALRDYVTTHLAAHRQPRRVAILSSLATTPTGKLDRSRTASLAAPLLRNLAR